MGEAKRKKEAVLNGICPCGAAKNIARDCCFDGRGWHKTAANLGLKELSPASNVTKCYMQELGSCIPPISGEHIISESVIKVLMADGDFSISGLPWLEAGEVKILSPKSLTANCLCTKHNSALSPLDDVARYFFISLKSYLEQDRGPRHALISGHDIERWLLKTAKATAVSRNLARGRERLSGVFARDRTILDMLDNPNDWPQGAGLYCIMKTGDTAVNHPRFQLQPITNEQDEIEAMALNILGLQFVLLLEPLDLERYPFLNGAKYRPGRIIISYPTSDNWITLSWEGSAVHDPLTIKFVKPIS